MVSDNLLLPGIPNFGEANNSASSTAGGQLGVSISKRLKIGPRKSGRRPPGELSCGDQVYFALRYWGALRRQTLLKLVPVSNESLTGFADRVEESRRPATVLRSIMNGQRVKIVGEDRRAKPPTLRGDVWIRNTTYVPEQKALQFSRSNEPELFSEGFLKRRFEGSAACNRILRVDSGVGKQAWSLERHAVWTAETVAALVDDINFFLPEFRPGAERLVLPELFLRQQLRISSVKQRELPRIRKKNMGPLFEGRDELMPFITRIQNLYHTPDAVFMTHRGFILIEVELSPKTQAGYERIFASVKKEGCFALYFVKTKQKEEITLNEQEWDKIEMSTDRQHPQRCFAFHKAKKFRNKCLEEKASMSEALVERCMSNPAYEGHLSIIMLDSESFYADGKIAVTRLKQYFLTAESHDRYSPAWRTLHQRLHHVFGTGLSKSAFLKD